MQKSIAEIKNAGSKNSVYSSSIHNCTEKYSIFLTNTNRPKKYSFNNTLLRVLYTILQLVLKRK